jgi:hypothetical protein
MDTHKVNHTIHVNDMGLTLVTFLDLMENVSKEAISLIDNIKDMDANVRLDKLKNLTNVLTETLKRGEEKVALAKSTFDAVSTC